MNSQQEIEKGYYADGEDAYMMKKMLMTPEMIAAYASKSAKGAKAS